MSTEVLSLYKYEGMHPPRKPRDFEVGKVQGMAEIDPLAFAIADDEAPAQIVQVEVYNPNIAYLHALKPADPVIPGQPAEASRYDEIRMQEERMNLFSKAIYKAGGWLTQRKAGRIAYEDQINKDSGTELSLIDTVDSGDVQSRNKFFSEDGILGDPALRLWRDMIPQASALTPLVNPYNTDEIRHPQDGRWAPMTDTTREWMTACTDGQEIFHRSAIQVEEMGTYLGKWAAAYPGETMTVMSVAGGTALSTMQGIMRSGVDPALVELVLLEKNEHSVQMAYELAARIGYKGAIIHKNTDVFSPQEMQGVKQELDTRGAKVVALDAVGIAEYSNKKLYTKARGRRFGEDYMLYNPDSFVKTCLGFLDEEGMAVIGQMRADRPNPYFTRGVVSWPTICMRSVKQFVEVLSSGGADMGLTKLSLTPLDTYTMATLYASERAARLGGLHGGEIRKSDHRTVASAFERVFLRRDCIARAATGQTVEE